MLFAVLWRARLIPRVLAAAGLVTCALQGHSGPNIPSRRQSPRRTWVRCRVVEALPPVEQGADYDLEKRAALEFWGKRAEQIVSGKRRKVLAL